MMQRLMLRSIGTAAYPRHNGQYHLSHKGAQQAHKGNAGQDGKYTRRVLTRSLGKAPHNAAMLPPLLWHIAFKQLCKHTAGHSDDVTSPPSCTACPFPSLICTQEGGASKEHRHSKSPTLNVR